MTILKKYTIVVESKEPPQILIGQHIGGAIVTELKQNKQELVSAAYIASIYSISVDTVRRKLASINQGTEGKCLYNPVLADELLKGGKRRGGSRRVN